MEEEGRRKCGERKRRAKMRRSRSGEE